VTSPSAGHAGIALASTPEAHRAMLAAARADATVPPIAAEAMATRLVDAGHASWCPICGGTGAEVVGARPGPDGLVPVTGTCNRCRGGRLNPFHGCTFTSTDPCACTTRCQAYQPQETPTP
jgi:streptogramin lyase